MELIIERNCCKGAALYSFVEATAQVLSLSMAVLVPISSKATVNPPFYCYLHSDDFVRHCETKMAIRVNDFLTVCGLLSSTVLLSTPALLSLASVRV